MQPIWSAITKFNPQVFIWMGDNIYGDIKRPLKLFGKERTIGPWKNVPRFVPASEQEMKSKYNIIKNNPDYSRLRQIAKVLASLETSVRMFCNLFQRIYQFTDFITVLVGNWYMG